MTKYLKNRKLNREKVKQYHDEMITGVAFVNQKESLWKYKNLWTKSNSYVQKNREKKYLIKFKNIIIRTTKIIEDTECFLLIISK